VYDAVHGSGRAHFKDGGNEHSHVCLFRNDDGSWCNTPLTLPRYKKPNGQLGTYSTYACCRPPQVEAPDTRRGGCGAWVPARPKALMTGQSGRSVCESLHEAFTKRRST
jgi:hypothetical protein